VIRPPPNTALQLSWHSALQSGSGNILASTLGASVTVGGLCHAAERPVRWAARMRLGVALLLPVLACSASAPIARIEVERDSPSVQAGHLAEAIGIETLGGVFTPLLEVGCSIPCETTKTFSTGANNQSEVSIALFRGTADLAAHNHARGRFAVVGIPPAPRGVPQVSITFRADSTAISISARELSGAAVQLKNEAQ
jgi:hypothetical protein